VIDASAFQLLLMVVTGWLGMNWSARVPRCTCMRQKQAGFMRDFVVEAAGFRRASD
jgi:hypothetical protein